MHIPNEMDSNMIFLLRTEFDDTNLCSLSCGRIVCNTQEFIFYSSDAELQGKKEKKGLVSTTGSKS